MRLITILFLMILTVACSRKTVPVKSEDRTVSRESVTDTIRQIVTDSSLIEALLECDSLGRVRIGQLQEENGRLVRQNLSLRDNILRIQAETESPERVREIVRTDTVTQFKEVPVPVEVEKIVYRLRWWQRLLCWIGVFYLVRLGVKLFFGFKNKSINSLKTILKII